jgi:hypothetical protein
VVYRDESQIIGQRLTNAGTSLDTTPIAIGDGTPTALVPYADHYLMGVISHTDYAHGLALIDENGATIEQVTLGYAIQDGLYSASISPGHESVLIAYSRSTLELGRRGYFRLITFDSIDIEPDTDTGIDTDIDTATDTDTDSSPISESDTDADSDVAPSSAARCSQLPSAPYSAFPLVLLFLWRRNSNKPCVALRPPTS